MHRHIDTLIAELELRCRRERYKHQQWQRQRRSTGPWLSSQPPTAWSALHRREADLALQQAILAQLACTDNARQGLADPHGLNEQQDRDAASTQRMLQELLLTTFTTVI